MKRICNTWAVVLAAGDGTRLSTLTTDSDGYPVPKQFCSLNGGGSLLHEAMQRAMRVVPRERICAIVAAQHRAYWRPELWSLPAGNVFVQPSNRGTAHGVLLSVLSILEPDPLARIVFLPADHYVADESGLAGCLRETVVTPNGQGHGLVLVGIEPDEPDPELGYIVPGQLLQGGSYTVDRFVEKPQSGLAGELLAAGALWNSFIFAAVGTTLFGMLRRIIPHSVEDMTTAFARDDQRRALTQTYERLDSIDFSQAVMQGAERSLRVIAAPQCGWTDLGTPKRVAQTLRGLDCGTSAPLRSRPSTDHRLERRRSSIWLHSTPGSGWLVRRIAVRSPFVCCVFTLASAHSAMSADIINQPTLTLEGAKRVAAAAVSYAKAHDAPVASIAVVDVCGHTIYVERLDGTFTAGSDISIGKARTAVVFKRATRGIEEGINKGRAAMVDVAAVTWFTPLQGGIPILVGKQIVGGVSGASSAQQDEDVAIAGAAAIQDDAVANSSKAEVSHVRATTVQRAFGAGANGETLTTGPGCTANASRRDGPGEAELHVSDTDILYVLQGSASVVTGGQIVGAHESAPGEVRGSAIEGGSANQIDTGDVLTIPEGVPHWFKSVRAPFRYYVIKSRGETALGRRS